jgi:hypothetical protein
MSYLETKANEWARNNMRDFNRKISTFKERNENYTSEKCKEVYKRYKELCIFDNILKVQYLFEDKNKIYNEIDASITNTIEKKDFADLYIYTLGNAHRKVFGKIYTKLSLIDKIEDANIKMSNLRKCIYHRINYHFNCKKYTKNYNVNSHKHEIMVSIFMYDRIKDIQKLLNKFKNKYMIFKQLLIERVEKTKEKRNEKIKEENEKVRKAIKEISDFESLSAISSSKVLSEPFIEINMTQRKKK